MSQYRPAAGALNARLHVAVDARDLARDGRGIGTYARAVLTRFVRRSDVRLTLLVRAWIAPLAAPPLREAIAAPPGAPLRYANRVPRDADVVWHPWNGTFFAPAVRRGRAIPAVATLHDLVPFAFPAPDAARRRSQQAPFELSARTARAILCDSAFTASEAQRYLGVEGQRLHVVPLGVDPEFSPGGLDALPPPLRGRRFVLHVGAHDAHKNVTTLVAAHRAAFAGSDVALVFTRHDPLVPEALVYAGASRSTLVALYRAALLVAVPSVYEGFGLPVLEGMACGAPVLAARAASLPEVGGETAAYVEAPRDAGAWRDALRALANDAGERARRAREGPARAARFGWETCAEQTLAVLAQTAHIG